MSFVRPEVAARLIRWREVLVALGIAMLGLWAFTATGWLVQALGVILMGAGLILAWIASRRVLFRTEGEAAGVVQVVEGRVSFFGPFYGGTVALDEITEIAIHATRQGDPYWHLGRLTEAPLVIPAAARGAEGLFDAFLTLPGLSAATVLTAQREVSTTTRVIWRRPGGSDTVRALT